MQDDEFEARFNEAHPVCEVCTHRGCADARFSSGAQKCFEAHRKGEDVAMVEIDGLWIHEGPCADFARASDREAEFTAAVMDEIERQLRRAS